MKRFPIYYKQIFKRWSENLSSFPNLPSAIASQVISKPYIILRRHKKIEITLDSFSSAMVNLNYGKNHKMN